jgi:nucleotide-binding universal stress UspA family protein
VSRFKTILVPVDFSSHSDAALEFALDLAGESGGSVHLLHAYALPLLLNAPYPMDVPDTVLEGLREEAARRLEATAEQARRKGAKLEVHLVRASPAPAISEAARDLDVDLIVMGTRGLTGLGHVLLGSVAERTIRTAPCPVLTVKGAAD